MPGTFAVAVCCCGLSPSRVRVYLIKQAYVSIAIGLIGEGFGTGLFVGKRWGERRINKITPTGDPARSSGTQALQCTILGISFA